MAAEPVHHEAQDPRDPEWILAMLPAQAGEAFLADYQAAVDAAHQVSGCRQLQELLQSWSVRAVAYSSPGFFEHRADARNPQPGQWLAAEDVIPGWADRLKQAL